MSLGPQPPFRFRDARRVLWIWALAASASLAFPAAASADTPMSYLKSFGAKADEILPLTWGLMVISIAVTVIVASLLIWALIASPRCAAGSEQPLPVDRPKGGLSWIYIGVGISSLVLFASAVWTMVTLAAVSHPTEKPAFTIEVTGHQWWWQVRYLSDDSSRTFVTANEIHVPVGKPVAVKLASADVIHSFWVPALTGKTDLIPGQTNATWFEASKPGIYRGQCTEYCGLQHAHMGLLVIASPPDQFEAWWNRQLEPAPAPAAEGIEQGKTTFIGRCGICHSVRGTRAGGIVGPDLSHLMLRRTIAAVTLPNNTGNLAGWISDPQHVKPGSYMPDPEVTPAQLQDILSYLHTLK
jgi:cytochrome c oxidase subunit 2